MEKSFKSIKKADRAKLLTRIILCITSILLGLILSFIFDNSIFLIISVVISMFISVIVIMTTFIKNRKFYELKDYLLNIYLPFMKFKTNNNAITEVYKIFGYKLYGDILEVSDSMEGKIDETLITSVSIKYHLHSCFKKKTLRLYKIVYNKNIKMNERLIKCKLLHNYRYEIKENILYLSTISNDPKDSFNPLYFKKYNDYVDRYISENEFLHLLIKLEEN